MVEGKGDLLNERALIADIFAPLAAATPGAFNLKDDAALLSLPPDKELVVTTDAIIEGVHFLPGDPPETIAAKALRVNLSDLAAKGAVPLGYTLTLALATNISIQWVEAFAMGLKADQETYKIGLYGGDTVKTPGPLSISITAFGTVASGAMVHRFGAAPGDILMVSGTIGDAALGLLAAREDAQLDGHGLSGEHKEFLVGRYRCPQPRCALASALSQFATAGMDVSDGLIGDVAALAEASACGATIDLGSVPQSDAVRFLVSRQFRFLERAVTGGDDYEIVFCVAPKDLTAMGRAAAQSGVAIQQIGVMSNGISGVHIVDEAGGPVIFSTQRYEH